MAGDKGLGSLFGKARQWAKQGIENATRIGGDPRERHAAEERNEDLGREIHDEAERRVQDAALEAALPQSVKDYRDHVEADRERRRITDAAEARADRVARVTESSLRLQGAITGAAEALAVSSFRADDGDLCVNVDAVDSVPMVGGTVRGFCFTIPAFHGDGAYRLEDHPEFDSLQYELYLDDEDNEGWGFHPSYGPGLITVTDGIADVRLTLGSAGNDTILLVARVVLGPPE